MRDLVFVHIPKTAGTSLRSALVAAFPEKRALFDYGQAEKLTSQELQKIRYSGKDDPSRLREFTGSDPILLIGHFPARDYLGLFAYDNFITFVRDPISRVVSDYKHYVRHLSYEKSLIEFASQPEQRNRQSTFLEGLDIENTGFIGVAEDYERSLTRLSNFLGRDIANIRSNQAPDNQIISVGEFEYSILSDLNSEDIKLYNTIININNHTHHNSYINVRGCANRTKYQLIRGWAVCDDPNRIVKLSLEIDGNIMHKDGIICDIYRPDLVKLGESPNGIGGFEIDLSQYNIGRNSVLRLVSEKWSFTI